MLGNDVFQNAQLTQTFTGHDPGSDLGQRTSGGFGHERGGTRGARIHLQNINITALDRKLHVHEPLDIEFQSHQHGLATDFSNQLRSHGIRWQGTGRVTGMDAGLLDVFHDAADDHLGSVTERIHVDLDCFIQKLVDQDRMFRRGLNRGMHITPQIVHIVDDLHRATTQHV